MKDVWPTVRLGELCQVARGGSPRPIKKYLTTEENGLNWIKIGDTEKGGRYINRTAQKIKPEGLIKSRWVEEGDFLLSNSMSFGRPYILQTDGCIHDGWLVLKPDYERVDQDYLYFVLSSPVVFGQFDSLASGATVRNLNIGLASKVTIPLPPLKEQRRIVAVLEEAFEGLGRARKNTEANLADARELFHSALEEAFDSDDHEWEERALSELGEITTGSTPPTKDQANYGSYLPFIKPGDFNPDGALTYHNQALSEKGAALGRILEKNAALMVCIGATIGKSGFSNRPIVTNQQINSIVPHGERSVEYLYYQMITSSFQEAVLSQAGQATLPIINKTKWSKLAIKLPSSIEAEAEIVHKLRRVENLTNSLTQKYRGQLLDLEELRQSILHKAFSGELRASKQYPISKPANDNTSPEFAASVLAYAYNAHAAEERQNTFGHVKAQKVLHLVEAVAGLDMGRDPIKDRAGPNDMDHMREAENWAKEKSLFRFQKERGREGYTFFRMKNFDAGLKRAQQQLASIRDPLDHILDVLVPMDSKQAEAVATTYAAWNNFLMDGTTPTDTQIARAASKEWHPDKRLSEQDCVKALAVLRSEKMVPDGSAKYVGKQRNLL